MKLPDKEPKAVLEAFEIWLDKGQDLGLLKRVRRVQEFSTITTEEYDTALFFLFFHELIRKDPGFEEVEDDAFEFILTEAYSGGSLLRVSFPATWYLEVDQISPLFFPDFEALVQQKGLVERWHKEEKSSYEEFRRRVWKLFFYELLRRGAITRADENMLYNEIVKNRNGAS